MVFRDSTGQHVEDLLGFFVRLFTAGIIHITAQPGKFYHVVLQHLAHMGRAEMLNRNIGGPDDVKNHF